MTYASSEDRYDGYFQSTVILGHYMCCIGVGKFFVCSFVLMKKKIYKSSFEEFSSTSLLLFVRDLKSIFSTMQLDLAFYFFYCRVWGWSHNMVSPALKLQSSISLLVIIIRTWQKHFIIILIFAVRKLWFISIISVLHACVSLQVIYVM